jgi:hypothetical protein
VKYVCTELRVPPRAPWSSVGWWLRLVAAVVLGVLGAAFVGSVAIAPLLE